MTIEKIKRDIDKESEVRKERAIYEEELGFKFKEEDDE